METNNGLSFGENDILKGGRDMTAEFDGNTESTRRFDYFVLQFFVHLFLMFWLFVMAMALTFPLDEEGKVNFDDPQNYVALPLFAVIEIGQMIFTWKKYYQY